MSIKHFLASLATMVAVVGGVTSAQDAMAPVGATFEQPSNPGIGSGVNFVSDQLMDYDMQMFAPSDYNLLAERQKPPTGVFFTYDRTMNGLTGPESTSVAGLTGSTINYTTWGNRFEFGFMGDHDKGWTATIQTMGGSTYLWGRTNGVNRPMLLDTKLQSYELNRVFRQELKHGGYFEPYIGGRVMYISDQTTQDAITLLPGLGDPTIEDFDRFIQESQNTMLGGTLGARFFKENGPVTWSGNLALALTNNTQFNSASNITFIDNTTQEGLIVDRGFDDNTFVPLLEGRLDFSYSVTRDISLRVGGQMMYFIEGLTRTNTLDTRLNPNSVLSGTSPFQPLALINNQDTFLYGVTFGVEWRR